MSGNFILVRVSCVVFYFHFVILKRAERILTLPTLSFPIREEMKMMVFFSRSVMNGATLFGVGLTILALSFALNFTGSKALIFAICGYAYLFASVIAFFFPNLSEK